MSLSCSHFTILKRYNKIARVFSYTRKDRRILKNRKEFEEELYNILNHKYYVNEEASTWYSNIDGKSFSEYLLYIIDTKGLKCTEVYKKAQVTSQHFSKIRNDKNYRTSKDTVIAFAIALELDIQDANELLKHAGYALSGGIRFDLIVEHFIRNRDYLLRSGEYTVMRLNDLLNELNEHIIRE